MRVIAVLLGLITLVGAALAQTGPATSDKPSAAASPSATVKTGSERDREESVAGQSRLIAPETGVDVRTGEVERRQTAPNPKEE
jgi:hypothetical protein